MLNEISCVNCNILQSSDSEMKDFDLLSSDSEGMVAAVLPWSEVKQSPVVQMVTLPFMKTIHTVKLGGDTIARGVLLATLIKYHQLVVALGDGFIFTYSVNLNSVAAAVAKMSC